MDLFDLGERIQAERKARGLSQAELADMAGISRVRLSHLETGKLFDVKFGTVLSILAALDLDVRVTTANGGRPTLDDLQRERDEDLPEP